MVSAVALAAGAVVVGEAPASVDELHPNRMEETEAYIPEQQQMPTPGYAGNLPKQK